MHLCDMLKERTLSDSENYRIDLEVRNSTSGFPGPQFSKISTNSRDSVFLANSLEISLNNTADTLDLSQKAKRAEEEKKEEMEERAGIYISSVWSVRLDSHGFL